MKNEKAMKIVRPHLLFILCGWCAVAAFTYYLLIYYPDFITPFNIWKLLFGILLSVLNVYMIIFCIRMRVAVASEFVEFSNIRTKRIYYTNIDRIDIDSFDGVTIISGKNKIKISRGVSNYDSVIRQLATRLSELSFKNFDGDRKLIKKYFNIENNE